MFLFSALTYTDATAKLQYKNTISVYSQVIVVLFFENIWGASTIKGVKKNLIKKGYESRVYVQKRGWTRWKLTFCS